MALISNGALRTGDKLPSLRVLASSMNLNINTVKKVFAELEDDGVVTTVLGSGTYISETAFRNPQILKKSETNLTEALRSAKSAGITKDEAILIVESIYREEIQ